jgi:hypothetical protein
MAAEAGSHFPMAANNACTIAYNQGMAVIPKAARKGALNASCVLAGA